MKTLYCIGRVIEMREGYSSGKEERPRIIKLSMEPNPYTPSFLCEISLGRGLHQGIEIGDRVKITLAKATEEEWVAFQERVKEPQAVSA